jgi:predicted ATPase
MFRLIEALRYRCLRDISQPLEPFQVLVGPNASGKTTFLDTIGFLSDLVRDGLDAAIGNRTANFEDLVWQRSAEANSLEIAVEAEIPKPLRGQPVNGTFDRFRYEVCIGQDLVDPTKIVIRYEAGRLLAGDTEAPAQAQGVFPRFGSARHTLETKRGAPGNPVFTKRVGQNDNYYSETTKGWVPSFKLGPSRSTLANLPEDETRFPVATWFKGFLEDGVQRFVLDSRAMRLASPPGQGSAFNTTGSNLPWVIKKLRESDPPRFKEWIAHLRTALGNLVDIDTVERPDDRHRYAVLEYGDGLKVPSWMASDGTLRLLALTLPAYLVDFAGVYLIEEPENGIHPCAVEAMFKSLSSVYHAQVLFTTHSPVVLSVAEPKNVLCFAQAAHGETDIVRGDHHPALREWRGEESLGVLFAGGVLG